MNVYQELASDIAKRAYINLSDAEVVVQALDSIGVLDYDNLKEIYLEEETES